MSERGDVLQLLDELYASEHAGAAAMMRWVAATSSSTLRGGLRVIAARDEAHAELALARLRALGGEPTQEPTGPRLELLRLVESAEVSDETKLRAMLARLPRPDGERISTAGIHIEEDRETRALVETMYDDDRVSLAWLRAVGDEGVPPVAAKPIGAAYETARGLAAFAAAEEASAAVFAAWGRAATHEGLRGGLRTIVARETTHARLLGARARELGAVPDTSMSSDVVRTATRWGSSGWSDEQKLDALLARYETPDAIAGPISPITADADPETVAMLRLIEEGEQTTIAWLRAYRQALRMGDHRLDNVNRFG